LRDFVAAYADPFGNQFGMNPGAAIDTPACRMDPSDLLQQRTITLRPRTLGALSPGVVATGRYAQKTAHQANRVIITAAVNAGESAMGHFRSWQLTVETEKMR
jgi:hypothetical protein